MQWALGRRVVALPGTVGLLLSFCIAWALVHIWKNTFDLFFAWLADKSIALPKLPDIHPFGFLHTISNRILSYLNALQGASERGLVWCLVALSEPFVLAAGVVLAIALSLYELGQYVAHKLPDVASRTVRATTDPLLKTLRASVAYINNVTIPGLRARLDALAAKVAHATHVATGAVAHTLPRLGRLERSAIDYAKLHKWINRALVGALGTTVVLAALKRLGLGWLRCSNVTRTGKAVCGMNPDLLTSLLGSALLLTSAISLRDLARELEEPTKLVTEGLHALIREF